MAVVNITSELYRSPIALGAVPDPVQVKGVHRAALGSVACGATDSTGSTYKLCAIPSHAILTPDTYFDVTDWGFAQVVVGSLTATDQLVDQTQATEDIVTPIAQGGADFGKRLWELLGLSEDPGGMIDLYLHAEAGAAGAGSANFYVSYLDNQ